MDRKTYLKSLSDKNATNERESSSSSSSSSSSMEIDGDDSMDHTEQLEKSSQPFPKEKLWKMPLTQQIIILLRRGNILSFKKLKEWTVPGTTDDQLLRALTPEAKLVHGYWVLESRHIDIDPRDRAARDYLLSLFATDQQIKRKHFTEVTGMTAKQAKKMLTKYAKLQASTGWKFKETEPDVEFIEQHPDLVKSSLEYWNIINNDSQSLLAEFKRKQKENRSTLNKKNKMQQLNSLGVTSNMDGMEMERTAKAEPVKKAEYTDELEESVKEHLIKLINLTASNNGVISKPTLHNIAESDGTLPNNIPQSIIDDLIEEMCVPIVNKNTIRTVYVLKSPEDDSDEDEWMIRDAIIEMFNEGNRWKKQEILKYVLNKTGMEISNNRYSKIMGQLANSTGGTWILKSG